MTVSPAATTSSSSCTEPVTAEPPDDEPSGTVRPTGHAVLAVLVAVGLVLGWLLRAGALRLGLPQPPVTWPAVGLIAFLAAALLGTAWATRRVVRRDRTRLAAHQAVNRLVLGKACALVGALLLGGYAGYALAQLGVGTPAAEQRLLRSALAALAALAMTGAALLLEHACRVRGPER